MPLQWTPGWLKGTRWAKRDDVLQNANYISTGSSPMAQETRPHGATRFHAILAIVPLHGGKVFRKAVDRPVNCPYVFRRKSTQPGGRFARRQNLLHNVFSFSGRVFDYMKFKVKKRMR
jgi:hypothetical protein